MNAKPKNPVVSRLREKYGLIWLTDELFESALGVISFYRFDVNVNDFDALGSWIQDHSDLVLSYHRCQFSRTTDQRDSSMDRPC